MQAKVNRTTIQVLNAEPLQCEADAIVVVTDTNLTLSPKLLNLTGASVAAETAKLGWLEVGKALLTGSGDLHNAKHLIHAVGPRWGEGSERGKLINVTWECLSIAEDNGLHSIVLPPISVGASGYPVEACAAIMLERIIDFTFEQLKSLKTVTLALEDIHVFQVFKDEFQKQLNNLQNHTSTQVRA